MPPQRFRTARPAEGEQVDRIVVASEIGRPLAQYAEMERMRDEFVRRHGQHGIHAVLVAQSGWYVRWFEGPAAAVRELLRHLQNDPRSHSHRVLHHSRGSRYLPTRWSMMLNPSTEPAASFLRRVDALYASRQRGVQYPPTSVVRRLCAPLRASAAAAAQDPESFHRVGVCSADDGRAFDLVRWLASRKHASAASRRVAGEDDLDSGSDYAEFVEDKWPCRVIAVSRGGLQHGLRRAFLPDWPFLLLLFGDHSGRNKLLMERVVQACQGLPATPRLLAVGPDPHMHARKANTARIAGLSYEVLGLYEAREIEEIWARVASQLREMGAPPSSQWDNTQANWVE